MNVFQGQLKELSVASKKEVMCASGGRAGLIRIYTSVDAINELRIQDRCVEFGIFPAGF